MTHLRKKASVGLALVALSMTACAPIGGTANTNTDNGAGSDSSVAGCSEHALVSSGHTKTMQLFDGSDYIVQGGPCFDLVILAAQKAALDVHVSLNKRFCRAIGAEEFAATLGQGFVANGSAGDMANDSRIPAQVKECNFSNSLQKPKNSVLVKYEKTADPSRVFPYLLTELGKFEGGTVREINGTATHTAVFTFKGAMYAYPNGYIVDDGKGNTMSVSVTSDDLMPSALKVANKALEVVAKFDE